MKLKHLYVTMQIKQKMTSNRQTMYIAQNETDHIMGVFSTREKAQLYADDWGFYITTHNVDQKKRIFNLNSEKKIREKALESNANADQKKKNI